MKYDRIFPWQGAHSYHRLSYHIVITPKYRRRIIHGALATRIRQLFFACAEINNWFVHEFEAMPDHVHFLLQLPATVSIARALMYLKGGSSRILRKEFKEIEEFLWGESFWADGYYAETIGRVDESVMRRYIKNQKNQDQYKPRPLGRGR